MLLLRQRCLSPVLRETGRACVVDPGIPSATQTAAFPLGLLLLLWWWAGRTRSPLAGRWEALLKVAAEAAATAAILPGSQVDRQGSTPPAVGGRRAVSGAGSERGPGQNGCGGERPMGAGNGGPAEQPHTHSGP